MERIRDFPSRNPHNSQTKDPSQPLFPPATPFLPLRSPQQRPQGHSVKSKFLAVKFKMSVEIFGPQGYEWQYLATVLLALQNDQCESLKVESINGEDAELRLPEAEFGPLTVYIQAKSGRSDVTIGELVGWLTHFESNSCQNTLLERIFEERSLAVFISGGRCRDDVNLFVKEFGIIRGESKVAKKLRDSLINALEARASKWRERTNLQKDRKKHLVDLVGLLRKQPEKLNSSLQRVIIWEDVSRMGLEDQINSELSRNYKIPQLACSKTVALLNQAVRNARDQRGDVYPAIQKILARESGYSILGSERHLSNGTETELSSLLRAQRVLLLTGRSQCGKTNMAKYLAQGLQDDGVHVQHGCEAEDASRFLSQMNDESRLFLLEDPFDELRSHTADERAKNVEILRRLIGELRDHRFLIMTCKSEAVDGVIDSLFVNRSKDLTVKDVSYLKEFWDLCCVHSDMDEETEKRFFDELKREPEDGLPQPGHLLHLAGKSGLAGLTFVELNDRARFDIQSLATNLATRTPLSRQLHVAIHLGASTVSEIPHEQIGYLFSGEALSPGIVDDFGVMSIFGDDESDDSFPVDPTEYQLAPKFAEELKYLEDSGFLRVSGTGIKFAHPDYMAVSRQILKSYGALGFAPVLMRMERGLCSNCEAVALVTASNIRIIHECFGKSSKDGKLIFDTAYKGRESIFPSVVEAVVEALLELSPKLDIDSQHTILRSIRNAEIYYGKYQWRNGIPWRGASSNANDLFRVPESVLSATALASLRTLTSKEVIVNLTAQNAWDYLHLVESDQNLWRDQHLEEIWKQPYAFIRAKCGKLLVIHYRDRPKSLISLIGDERSPSVKAAVILQIFSEWRNLAAGIRTIFEEWLVSEIRVPVVAISVSNLLVNFGDPHNWNGVQWADYLPEEKTEVWGLWATVIQGYFDALSSKPFNHDGARLYSSFQNALRYITQEKLEAPVERWMDWIEGQVEIRELSDYDVGAIRIYFDQKSPSASREERLSRLLGSVDTGLVFNVINLIAPKWTSLSVGERELISDLLSSDRHDVLWFKAAAIVRTDTCDELQQLITGLEGMSTKGAGEILEELDSELLKATLHVYCGSPQPLWWYGTHHPEGGVWKVVLEIMLTHPDHALLDLAIEEMLYSVLNGGLGKWSEPLESWRGLCQSGDPNLTSRLFDHLLFESVTTNNPQSFGFWGIFFEALDSEDDAKKYASKIVEFLPKISMNVSNLGKFFGPIFVGRHLRGFLNVEVSVVRNLETYVNSPDSAKQKEAVQELSELLDIRPLKLYNLFKRIEVSLSGKFPVEESRLKLKLGAVRKAFLAHQAEPKSAVKRSDRKVEIWNWQSAFQAIG